MSTEVSKISRGESSKRRYILIGKDIDIFTEATCVNGRRMPEHRKNGTLRNKYLLPIWLELSNGGTATRDNERTAGIQCTQNKPTEITQISPSDRPSL